MERLKYMKEQLSNAIQAQMCDLRSADTYELGQAVDMLKDVEEAMYYCAVTDAMLNNKKEDMQTVNYYTEPHYYYSKDDEMARPRDLDMRRYYNNMGMGNNGYQGRSGESRRMYMESKEMHHDKSVKMQELESYMKDLSKDLVEMIEDSSPEEKQLLQQKLTALSNKIAQTNV